MKYIETGKVYPYWDSLVGQMVKSLPVMQEIWV